MNINILYCLKRNSFFSFLFLLMVGYSLLTYSSSNSIAQVLTPSPILPSVAVGAATVSSVPDTYTITLLGPVLNTVGALNITVSFTPNGSAQIENTFTLKANGASILLSNVDSDKNIITAVLNGSITDGKAVITGNLKKGSVNGNPTITVTKVEQSGSISIINDLQISALLSSSTQPIISPTSSPSPSPSSTPQQKGPSLSIVGPDLFVLKLVSLNVIHLKAKVSGFTAFAKCTVQSSKNSFLSPKPRTFVLTPQRDSKIFFGVVPPNITRKLIKGKLSEDVTVSVSCSSDVDGNVNVDKNITIAGSK